MPTCEPREDVELEGQGSVYVRSREFLRVDMLQFRFPYDELA